MKHTLEHHKLKKTATREVVLAILEKTTKPLSVDDIFSLAKNKSLDVVTIYRTLETFAAAGIVKEVLLKDRTTRYEIIDEHGGHCHHAICNSCGASEHVDDPQIEKALQTLAKKFKRIKNVNEHILEFFGVCDACSKIKRI